jgi:hypothetical protein
MAKAKHATRVVRHPHNITEKMFSLTNLANMIYCSSSSRLLLGSGTNICGVDGCNHRTSKHTNLGGSCANETGILEDPFFTGEGLTKSPHLANCVLSLL